MEVPPPTNEIELAMTDLVQTMRNLKMELQKTAIEHADSLFQGNGTKIGPSMKGN